MQSLFRYNSFKKISYKFDMKITENILGSLNVTNFILSVPIRKITLESYTNLRNFKTEPQKKPWFCSWDYSKHLKVCLNYFF